MSIPKDAVISIAGTVGIGKSTLTSALANALQYNTSFEKVEGNPYLDLFYNDFERWSFHLQIYFLAERFKEQKRIFENQQGFIQDRSIYEDTGIFANMLYEKGNMTKTDYDTYTSLFDSMILTPYFPKPDLLIYLDAPLSEVLERVAARGREMEKQTPIDYWRELHNRYVDWIDNFTECPVLKININEYDLINNPDSISVVTDKIEDFFLTKAHKKSS